ncbi:DHA2 family efflux MFS transporter permease subunit [Solicola gregarius]|uniref:DHA2 family efflux MFS transporter permease subunit n=1 Tax=Solicola gregarius TaxID=2908642 RepID=A0AA46TFY1_9ACTN|nr:DHA2 family efflux MFS transporter permease subunit [Solicola gregarius]UYM04629.1 DHA2 family efflux MFS transporter permease subunit [Solicola gregarius]
MTTAQRWVLGITAVASFMVVLDVMVVMTALDAIRTDLGASLEDLEWTVTAYTLTFAVLLMPAAALGERFGRRRVLIVGLSVFSLASAACALAPGVGWLVAARVVQGVGAAGVTPVALAVLSAAFTPQRRGAALGLFAGVTGLATLGGPVVGGVVVEAASWQWIFWLNLPIGAVLVPLAWRRIDEAYGTTRRLDVVGMVLIAVGCFGVVWALVRGNAAGWDSPEVLGALAVGIVAVAAFVRWELRSPQPMLPMPFFARRGFAAGNAATFLMFAAMFGAVFFLAQFFQAAQGTGPLGAGLRLAPLTVTLSVVAPLVGPQIGRIGERSFVTTGMAALAVGFGWLGIVATRDAAYVTLVVPLVVAGVGASMVIPAAQSAVLGAVPASGTGAASGTFNMLRQLGGAFGIAVTAAVFAGYGGYGSAVAYGDGFGPALATVAGMALLGAFAAGALPSRDRRDGEDYIQPPNPTPVQATSDGAGR